MSFTVGTNSFLSVADADTYWSDRADTTWAAATTANKQKALLMATAYLDSNFDWKGVLADVSQSLGWPRLGAYDDEGRALDGTPQKVKDATCELAKLALSDELDAAQDRAGAIQQLQAGSVGITFEGGAPTGKYYRAVLKLLTGIGVFRGTTALLVRG